MINLLPPKQKEELRQEQKYKLFLISEFLVAVFLITLSLSFLAARIYISGQIAKTEASVPEQLLDSQKTINEINKNFEKIQLFYSSQPDFAKIIEKISDIIPPDLSVTSFSMDLMQESGGFPVSLRGFSPTRDLLFQFKKNLESQDVFIDIDFPASNWIKASNINFEVSFKIEP